MQVGNVYIYTYYSIVNYLVTNCYFYITNRYPNFIYLWIEESVPLDVNLLCDVSSDAGCGCIALLKARTYVVKPHMNGNNIGR